MIGTVSACGSGDEVENAASQPGNNAQAAAFNAADVTFAQSMTPHHQQAVEMGQLAASRAKNPAVKKLAAQIVSAQDPEISSMTDWLTAWGKPLVPDMGSMDHSSMSPEEMAAMGSGGMAGMAGMPGMAEKADLSALEAAKGTKFDTQFLTLMLEHHRGAVEMAQTEVDTGQNPDATALAEQIVKTQTAEIKRIENLLKA